MLMKHGGHRVRGVITERCRALWWTIKHPVIIPPLGTRQQPHAHSSIHKQASLPLYVSSSLLQWNVERESWPGRCWRSTGTDGPAYYGIYSSHLLGSGPIGWSSYIHTFNALGSFQLEAGVGPGRPRGRAAVPDSNSSMPSIRSSWVGELTRRLDNEPVTSNTLKTQLCIGETELWSSSDPSTSSFIDSSVNLIARSVSVNNFRMNCFKYYIKITANTHLPGRDI